jgi:hypothetical protein
MAPGDQVGGWGVATYGEPCTGCGFRWHRTLDDVVLVVAQVPDTYDRVRAAATGRERHPDLAWSVSAYVCPVGDNLRIWAERLAGIARGAFPEVSGYDETALGRARGYGTIPLPSAAHDAFHHHWDIPRSLDGGAGPCHLGIAPPTRQPVDTMSEAAQT